MWLLAWVVCAAPGNPKLCALGEMEGLGKEQQGRQRGRLGSPSILQVPWEQSQSLSVGHDWYQRTRDIHVAFRLGSRTDIFTWAAGTALGLWLGEPCGTFPVLGVSCSRWERGAGHPQGCVTLSAQQGTTSPSQILSFPVPLARNPRLLLPAHQLILPASRCCKVRHRDCQGTAGWQQGGSRVAARGARGAGGSCTLKAEPPARCYLLNNRGAERQRREM